ncbi:MAG: glycosyltransferase family 2 protein, partial [Dehalococcoidia bacterium]|nr:glycosyltransferase family 2 protein [Dehalococcoidia bacterium]
ELYARDLYPRDYPDADVLVMLHRRGFRIVERPVVMYANRKRRSMHGGIKPLYYVSKVLFSITLNLLRGERT